MPIPTLRRSLFVAFPLAVSALLAVGCGGSADGSNVSGSGDGSQGSNTGAGSQPSLGDPNNPNGSGGTGSNGGVTVINKGSECASSSGTADAVPAVVQMVVDISGSMNWAPGTMDNPPRGQDSKWDITSAALKAAVAKLPANIAVGVNFYPNNPPRNSCIRNRVDVPINLLGAANSAQRRAFNTAIDGADPDNGTPTHAAYNFGLQTLNGSDLEGRKFILLITDGVPTFTLECMGAQPEPGMTPVDNAPLISAVEAAYAGGSGASTFVIGSPGSEDAREDLSKMASLGGTKTDGCSDTGPNYCHLDMTTAQDFAAALTAGLAQVAGQISTCEYVIPPSPTGQTLNPQKVNVLYTKGDGTESSLGKGNPDACDAGWKYDSETNPTKIILCGSDCEGVKADLGSKIDVIFGCDTVVEPPVK
ncbi:MAG: VWA domain-containing protein [Myxococcales bacterium]|nr:MAG: VWA domain-containing protein [Myxococcales bacterium]